MLSICTYGGIYYQTITTFLVFPFQILFITSKLTLKTRDGHAGNLATLIRKRDISMDYSSHTGDLKVFGSVGLSQLYVRHMSA